MRYKRSVYRLTVYIYERVQVGYNDGRREEQTTERAMREECG